MSAHNLLQQLFLDAAPFRTSDPGDGNPIVIDRWGQLVLLESGATAETRTLPAPTKPALLVTLNMQTDGGGDITVTVTGGYNADADTAVVFADAGDSLVLESIATAEGTYRWRVIRATGVDVIHGSADWAIPTTNLRTSAFAALGTSAAAGEHNLNLSGSILTAKGCGGNNAWSNSASFIQVQIPPDYVPGGTLSLSLKSAITINEGAATAAAGYILGNVFKSYGNGYVGTDLCAGNGGALSTSWSALTLTITPTTLNPSDVLNIKLTSRLLAGSLGNTSISLDDLKLVYDRKAA